MLTPDSESRAYCIYCEDYLWLNCGQAAGSCIVTAASLPKLCSYAGETHRLRSCPKREMRSRSLRLTAKSSMELVALPRPFAQLQKSSVGTVLKFYPWLKCCIAISMWLRCNSCWINIKPPLRKQMKYETSLVHRLSAGDSRCFKQFFHTLLISASFLLTTCSWSTRYWKPSSELWEGLRQTERDKKVSPEGVHLFYHTEFHTGLAW